MLQPSQTKRRKQMKGRSRGVANVGNSLTVGEFALKAMDRFMMTGNQIEAARKVIVRETGRKGKLWLRVFPDKPITRKPAEVRMGSGKGALDHYVCVIKPGRVLFELGGVPEEIAKLAFSKAMAKLPVKCIIITKNLI